jgi:hypothetical protein
VVINDYETSGIDGLKRKPGSLLPVFRVGNIQTNESVTDSTSTDFASIPKYRMHAMCIKFQKDTGANIDGNTELAACSSHVSGCFRCQKRSKKSKHVCGQWIANVDSVQIHFEVNSGRWQCSVEHSIESLQSRVHEDDKSEL